MEYRDELSEILRELWPGPVQLGCIRSNCSCSSSIFRICADSKTRVPVAWLKAALKQRPWQQCRPRCQIAVTRHWSRLVFFCGLLCSFWFWFQFWFESDWIYFWFLQWASSFCWFVKLHSCWRPFVCSLTRISFFDCIPDLTLPLTLCRSSVQLFCFCFFSYFCIAASIL